MTDPNSSPGPIRKGYHLVIQVLTLRRPRGLRVNPLFDDAWYRETYSDAPATPRAAYRQFRSLALSEDRDPNEYFDTAWYLERNPDVAPSGLHPIDHYLEYGWREGRDPGPTFDGAQYLRYHPEAVELDMNPLLHQLRSGVSGTLGGRPGSGLGARFGDDLDKLTQHYRRFGLRRTTIKVVERLSRRGPTLEDHAAAPVVAEVEPARIQAALETPRIGTVEDGSTLFVQGWAVADVGVEANEIYVDGVHSGFASTGQPRPDVAAKRHAPPEAAHSGFASRTPLGDLEPGTHALQVVLSDAAGHVRVLVRAFETMAPGTLYHRYYRRSLPTPAEQAAKLAGLDSGGARPTLHVVVLDRGDGDLGATLASLESQLFPAWSRTVLTRPERVAHVEEALLKSAVDTSPGAWTIATETLSALPLQRQRDRFIAFMHAGEVLAPGALLAYASIEDHAAIDVIYSDHDSIGHNGRHIEPWFVGDWAPQHILSQDYIGGVFMARDSERLRTLVAASVPTGRDRWRYELLLALSEGQGRIAHIPRVLWSAPADSSDGESRSAAELAAVAAALERREATAEVRPSADRDAGPVRHVEWPLTQEALVSLVIPTTGRIDLVETTLAYLDATAYPQVERIFIDNSRGEHPDGIAMLRRSGATVIERDQPFNWAALSNDGAREASGELLLFLNDDLHADDPDWLTELVRQALRPDVGAVGPLLLYPDGRIQHAGVFTVGHGGGAVHLFHGLDPTEDLHLGLHRVAREVTAVTGACLMVERRAFRAVGGFNEDLAVIGNDIDLCLRIARAGKATVWTPAATLVHTESASRTSIDHLPDEDRMWRHWSDVLLGGDPYYNPNLTAYRVDAAIDWERVSDRRDPITHAEVERGVNLIGYISAEMGVGEATRGEAHALSEADVPFGIIDYRYGNPSRMGDRTWSHRMIEEPLYATNVLHINADSLPGAIERLPADLLEGRRNIGFWTWELPRFPKRFHGAFDLVDEVWVPSTFVAEAVSADAPVPVHVVPHVVERPSRPPLPPSHCDIRGEGYRFLAMYDTQSVQARKNPQGAVEAYMRAFETPTADATLVVKVNNAADRELEPLRDLIDSRPDISLVTDVLSRHEVDSLIATSDAFVSLHRAEGFGLVIAEAMSMGKPVIATGWSGNTDFMSVETSALVGYALVEIDTDQGPYEAGQRWAEPDLDDAAEWMRRLRDDPDVGSQMGARAAASIARNNDAGAIGRIIATTLITGADDRPLRSTATTTTIDHASSAI